MPPNRRVTSWTSRRATGGDLTGSGLAFQQPCRERDNPGGGSGTVLAWAECPGRFGSLSRARSPTSPQQGGQVADVARVPVLQQDARSTPEALAQQLASCNGAAAAS